MINLTSTFSILIIFKVLFSANLTSTLIQLYMTRYHNIHSFNIFFFRWIANTKASDMRERNWDYNFLHEWHIKKNEIKFIQSKVDDHPAQQKQQTLPSHVFSLSLFKKSHFNSHSKEDDEEKRKEKSERWVCGVGNGKIRWNSINISM